MNIKTVFQLTFLILSFSLSSLLAQAEENSRFDLPLSLSTGIGTLESSDLGLKSRTMNALSFEILPSLRRESWFLGLHLDYRVQGQMTSLSEAGGTNLKGKGYFMGVGLGHHFHEKYFAQISLDFFGKYDLQNHTSSELDDELMSPFGVRFKTGAAFIESLPNLTFDLDMHYLTYAKIRIAGKDIAAKTTQMMLAIGMTYRFSSATQSKQASSIERPTTPPVPLSPVVAQPESIDLPSSSFASASATLQPEAKNLLAEIANKISKNEKLRIEGHTDSSGNEAKNILLSKARAEAVKAELVANGFPAQQITALGFGSSQAVADNQTVEGRAKNRRVQIFIEAQEGSK